jgi:predicted nucleotidyltransferase
MKREICTRKLKRILSILCTEKFTAPPRALFVFGSYSRGAEEPGDLDLLLVYDLPTDWESQPKTNEQFQQWRSELTKRFRRADTDIIYDERGFRLRGIVDDHDDIIPSDGLILLWSREDQDWEPKLAAIQVNPLAGRAPRDHFFDIKRLNSNLATMEEMSKYLKEKKYALTKKQIDLANDPVPSISHRKHLRLIELLEYRVTKTVSRNILMMKYGFAWLESEMQFSSWKTNADKIHVSEHNTHAIVLGSPLDYVLWLLNEDAMQKVCYIPIFHPHKENVMLIFERGPNFASSAEPGA